MRGLIELGKGVVIGGVNCPGITPRIYVRQQHTTQQHMTNTFKIVMRPRNAFLVEKPDGTRTNSVPYDTMLSFIWDGCEHIAHTCYYGDERVLRVADVADVDSLDESCATTD